MRKIMFFDIDGTLIPEEEGAAVPQSTRTALVRAREAGNLLYVNTGRPAVNVNEDVRELGFDGYVFGCGTHIVCGEREIYYSTVDRSLCRETVSLLRLCDAVPMFEQRDGVFFDFEMRSLPMIDGIRRGFAAQGKNVDRSAEDEDLNATARRDKKLAKLAARQARKAGASGSEV